MNHLSADKPNSKMRHAGRVVARESGATTLRILHVLNHVRDVGNGIVNVVVDLACAQRARGHEVAVVSSGGEFEPLLEARGVRHIRLSQRRSAFVLLASLPGMAA